MSQVTSEIHVLEFIATGAVAVFDLSLVSLNPEKILGFSLNHKCLMHYNRVAVEGCIRKCLDKSRADLALSLFEEWKRSPDAREYYKKAGEWRQARIDAAVGKHKNLFEKKGLNQPTIRYGSNSRHRVTHCWNCKHSLNNSIDPECSGCGWIICDCGACGCRIGGHLDSSLKNFDDMEDDIPKW